MKRWILGLLTALAVFATACGKSTPPATAPPMAVPNPGLPPLSGPGDSDPSWSPDGSRIAYRHHAQTSEEARYGWEQVWVYTLATGENVYVTSGEYLAWSPQGDILAIAEGNLYLVSLFNLTRTQVTRDMYVAHPTWAPDGQRLAFDVLLQQPADPAGIFVIAADGTGLTQITTLPGSPAWSPDGTKIAFVQGNDLFTMSMDGQNRVHLAYDPYAPGDPDWSPDGRFLAWNEDGYATMTLHADGSDNHVIRVGVFEPAWSPDGSQIACAMIEPGNPTSHIYLGLMNADGSNPRFLTGPNASKP